MAPTIARVDERHLAPAHSSLKLCPWASIGWNSLSLGLGIRPPPKKATSGGGAPLQFPTSWPHHKHLSKPFKCVITLRGVGLPFVIGHLHFEWNMAWRFVVNKNLDTKKDTCYDRIGLCASFKFFQIM